MFETSPLSARSILMVKLYILSMSEEDGTRLLSGLIVVLLSCAVELSCCPAALSSCPVSRCVLRCVNHRSRCLSRQRSFSELVCWWRRSSGVLTVSWRPQRGSALVLLSLEQRCILMGCHLGAFLDRSGQSAGSESSSCPRGVLP